MKPSEQRVVVTAGAAGIGRAIVDAFLDTGAGVHVADLDERALERLPFERPGLSASVADVSNADDVSAMFVEARRNMGEVSVLINCAGTAGPTAPLEDISPVDWRDCLAVNLDGAYLCAREVITDMKAAGRGSIINLSSTAGFMGFPLRTPYAAAKWAIIGLTKSLAMELGPYGIRVNAICPGSVEGERMDAVIAADAVKRGVDEAEIRESYKKAASLRTFISPEDIANTALFLCSPAGDKISGQAIPVDGHAENVGTMDI